MKKRKDKKMNKTIPEKPIKKLRKGKLNIKKLRGKIKKILNQKKSRLKKPKTKNLYTDKIYIPPEKEEKKDQSIYIKGEKYHPIIGKICNMVNSGISPQIYIVGQQRYGKSKTAHYIAKALHNEINLLRDEYDPENQLIYNNIEYLLGTAKFKRKAMICDEAENYLNTKDRWTDFVQNVGGLIRSQSIRGNPQIIVTPTFKYIAPQIRKHVDIIINMKGKMKATVKAIQSRHDKVNSRGYDYLFTTYPYWYIPKLPKKEVKRYDKLENKYKGEYSLKMLIEGIDKQLNDKEDKEIASL